MKIGINGTGLVGRASTEAITAHAQEAYEQGFESYWIAEHPTGGFDALTVLTAVGLKVPEIKLGTAIIPTWPRHPSVLAGQAKTTNNILDGRLILGIGLSHAPMMAELGLAFDKPIGHLREYLNILMPLVSQGTVEFSGDTLSARAKFFGKAHADLPVLVAALGPQALRVAGRLADGTILAWVGPKTVTGHIRPTIFEAAENAGRPQPQIVASLPVCVTHQEKVVRQKIGEGLSMYGQLPSYRAMFDREGADGPADVAIVGSEEQVLEGIAAMRAAGVSEFAPTEFFTNAEEAAQTRALLQKLISQG
jgi:F420-dependent oxidoreductase-like protein